MNRTEQVISYLRGECPAEHLDPDITDIQLHHLGPGLAVVTGARLAEATLSDPRLTTSAGPHQPLTGIPEVSALFNATLTLRDGADHTRLRRIIAPHFSRRAAEIMRPRIATMIAERWPSDETFDLVGEFADVLPLSIALAVMGLPAADEPILASWAHLLRDQLGRFDQDEHTHQRVRATLTDLREYADAALRHPVPNSALASVENAAAAGEIDADERLGLFVLLLVNGLETLSQALVAAVRLADPSTLEAAAAGPAGAHRAFRTVLATAPPLRMLARRAACPADIGDAPVDTGTVVITLLPVALRDATRSRAPSAPPAALGYGFGPHICLGMHHADVTGAELLRFLAARFRRIDAVAGAVPHPSPAIDGFRRYPIRPVPLFPIDGGDA